MNSTDKIITEHSILERNLTGNDRLKLKIDLSQHSNKSPLTNTGRESSSSGRFLHKKRTISQNSNPQTSISARLNINTSSSPLKSSLDKMGFERPRNEATESVFANIYEKIMSQNPQSLSININTAETPIITPRIVLGTSSSRKRIESSPIKHRRQKTFDKIETALSAFKSDFIAVTSASLIKAGQPLESNRTGKSSAEINTLLSGEERYKYNRTDSKYVEIVDLKSKNESLVQQNRRLKQDIAEIDHFDEVIKTRPRPEMFNEKRCDMLKFCIKKQRLQINCMSKSIRLCHAFYKDMQHVLSFLVEMNEKYVKSKPEFSKEIINNFKTHNSDTDIAYQSLFEIFKELGSAEPLDRYVSNFNEAYSQVREMYQADAEIKKLFDPPEPQNAAADESPSHLDQKTSGQQFQYNNVLKQFVEKYKRIFPLYTAFDDFELKDQKDFSVFLEQIITMSKRINYNFNKMNSLNFLEQTAFLAKSIIPNAVKENQKNFKNYFNSMNPNKRIILQSEEVLKTEKSLANLLEEFRTLHDTVSAKKNIPLEDLSRIQESIRFNIERLLLLGITVNDGKSKDEEILLISQNNLMSGSQVSWQSNNTEQSELIEIYNHEAHNINKYEQLKFKIRGTLDKALNRDVKKSPESDKKMLELLKTKIEHLERICEENALINRLKDKELLFLRNFAQNSINEVAKLKSFTMEKLDSLKDYLQGIENEIQSIEKAFDAMNQNPGSTVKQAIFQRTLTKSCMEIKNSLHRVLSGQKDFSKNGTVTFEEAFRIELSKVKRRISRNESNS